MLRSPLDGLVRGEGEPGMRPAACSFRHDAARTDGGRFPGTSGYVVLEVYSGVGMEVRVKVSEQERANVVVGQTATVRADVLPGRTFRGRVLTLAGLASRGGMFDSAGGPLRQFDVAIALDQPDPRLRAGTSVRALIAGTEAKGVLTVPRQALFEKNGKSVVYIRAGELFTPREVKVTHRTESRVALDGIAEGTEVALVNPDKAGPGTSAGLPERVAPRREACDDARPPARLACASTALRTCARTRTRGIDNLRSHKLRSLLTMLGMIFGVAAVVAMLSIGAGRAAGGDRVHRAARRAQRHRGGARDAGPPGASTKVRKLSAGLSLQDLRVIETNLPRLRATSRRKRVMPTKMLPKPQGEMPMVYGVAPAYATIAGLRRLAGPVLRRRRTARRPRPSRCSARRRRVAVRHRRTRSAGS